MKFMKKVLSIIIISIIALWLFSSCNGTKSSNNYNTIQNTYYTVTFRNWDGSFICETKVKYGEYATYSGQTPVRESDGDSDFVFKGWGGIDSKIYRDTTITAYYETIPITTTDTYSNVKLKFEACDGGYKITKFVGFKDNWNSDPNIAEKRMVLPSEYNGSPVVAIGDEVFNLGLASTSNAKLLRQFTTVSFPKHLREIGEWSFADMYLKEVKFPSSLRKIGPRAFAGCYYLNNIVLNNGLQEICDNAFRAAGDTDYYSGMRTLRIPLSVTKVGKGICSYSVRRDVCFYCEAASKPSGWDDEWNLKKDGRAFEKEYYTDIYWGA